MLLWTGSILRKVPIKLCFCPVLFKWFLTDIKILSTSPHRKKKESVGRDMGYDTNATRGQKLALGGRD